MKDILIANTPRYSLFSHGNGAAYTLYQKATGESMFFQYGDEAAAFRDAFDKEEISYDRFLQGTWEDYHSAEGPTFG